MRLTSIGSAYAVDCKELRIRDSVGEATAGSSSHTVTWKSKTDPEKAIVFFDKAKGAV